MERDQMIATLMLLGWQLIIDDRDGMPGLLHEARLLIYWRSNALGRPYWDQDICDMSRSVHEHIREACYPAPWAEISTWQVRLIYAKVMAHDAANA